MTAPRLRRHGFTIVELLVVISIIAVLMGLLLPALNGAARRGRKADEMNYLRQLGVAWNLYAQSNRDSALPGFLDSAPGPAGPSVQEDWRVRFEYANGKPADPDDAEEWPWRLLQYLDYSDEIIFGHLDLDVTGPQAMSDQTLMDELPHRNGPLDRPSHVAEEPQFAYNGFYVGGYYDDWLEYEVEGANGPETRYSPRHRFGGQVTGYYYSYSDGGVREGPFETRTSVVTRSAAQLSSASTILFCSASRMPVGEFHEVAPDRFGTHVVVPPYLARTAMWKKSTLTPSDTTLEVRNTLDGENAPVPVGRHTGSVASVRADLHTDASAPGTLDDQRLWLDRADTKLWYHDPQ